jgi:hypothetical protein
MSNAGHGKALCASDGESPWTDHASSHRGRGADHGAPSFVCAALRAGAYPVIGGEYAPVWLRR